MKEYRKVVQFNYKNNLYNMYLDKDNKKFFLRVGENGNLYYISSEELQGITNHLLDIPYVMNIMTDSEKESKKHKIKTIPKIIIGGVLVSLTLPILSGITGITSYKKANDNKYTSPSINTTEQTEKVESPEVDEYVSYSTFDDYYDDNREGLIVDTYINNELSGNIYVYDMSYLDMALPKEEVTLEKINNVVDNNPKINKQFKKLIKEYSKALFDNYNDIELRVFYNNLKTLEIVECDERELMRNTLSYNSDGCYVRTENRIYVPEGYEYKKGTWEYQVIFHELSHCLRTGVYDTEDHRVRVQVEGLNYYNTITAEALNSLFTVSLFDYTERDIAYQLQSNYHQVIIECMDNYTLSDYVNHSLSYYAKKLDEFNNDDNYATTILDLIEFQYKDFHSDDITVEQSEYYPIYDYITNMYFNKYITPNTSYQEAKQITDGLLDKILYDVPEEYNIDTNHFYENLDNYCQKVGIQTTSKTR